MDWFLRPESVSDKLLVMVFAIVLFVAIMSAILWLIDRPKVPQLGGRRRIPRPGHHRAGHRPVLPGRSARRGGRSRSAQAALGPDGKADHQSGRPARRSTELVFSLANYDKVFTDPNFQKVLINTVLVGHPGAGPGHRLRADLRGAG